MTAVRTRRPRTACGAVWRLVSVACMVACVAAESAGVPADTALEAAMEEAGNASVVEIDGADHFFLDLFAEDVADHMEAFLGGG